MTGLAVPIPYTWSPGDIESAALLNAQIRDSITFLLNKPIATLLQTVSTQTFTTATWTTLTWDATASVDTYGGYNSGTSTSKYVAQVAGTYRVNGLVNLVNNATGLRAARLAKNGTAVQGAQERRAPAPATGTTVPVGWEIPLAVGDYVELLGFQASGGNLATLVDSETCSSLRIEWLHA